MGWAAQGPTKYACPWAFYSEGSQKITHNARVIFCQLAKRG